MKILWLNGVWNRANTSKLSLKLLKPWEEVFANVLRSARYRSQPFTHYSRVIYDKITTAIVNKSNRRHFNLPPRFEFFFCVALSRLNKAEVGKVVLMTGHASLAIIPPFPSCLYLCSAKKNTSSATSLGCVCSTTLTWGGDKKCLYRIGGVADLWSNIDTFGVWQKVIFWNRQVSIIHRTLFDMTIFGKGEAFSTTSSLNQRAKATNKATSPYHFPLGLVLSDSSRLSGRT